MTRLNALLSASLLAASLLAAPAHADSNVDLDIVAGTVVGGTTAGLAGFFSWGFMVEPNTALGCQDCSGFSGIARTVFIGGGSAAGLGMAAGGAIGHRASGGERAGRMLLWGGTAAVAGAAR